VAARLRSVFAGLLVPGVAAAANFSIYHAPDEGRVRGLYTLYQSGQVVSRGRTVDAALDSLACYLAEHNPVSDGLLRVPAVTVIGDEQAWILPRVLVHILPTLAPRLKQARRRAVDLRIALIDPDAGPPSVVVPAPVIDVSPAVPPGRYPIAGWVLLGGATDPSAAVAEVAAAMDGVSGDVLPRLASALTAVPRRTLESFDVASVLGAVR